MTTQVAGQPDIQTRLSRHP